MFAFLGPHKRGLLILLVFTFFMSVGFEMLMPLVIGHYVNDIGFTATAVTFALALRKFLQQGLALFGGRLADSFQIRTLICAGVLLRMLGFGALAFAEGYFLLLLAMALTGLGGVLFDVPYQAAVALLTTEENRPRYYSLSNTLVGIAGALGPLLGAILLRLDFRLVCFGAAGCFLINFLLSCLAMPPIVRAERAYPVRTAIQKIVCDRRYRMFLLLMVLFWFAAAQIDISFPLKAVQIFGSGEGVGVMYAVYATVTMAVQYPLVAFASRRLSCQQSAAVGACLIAAALYAAAFAARTLPFMAAAAVFAVGMALARPNQRHIAVSMADPRSLGMYLGAGDVTFAIGSGIGGIMGGALFDLSKQAHAGVAPWFVFASLAVVSVYGFWISKGLKQIALREDPYGHP
ncbi:MAG: MFS transporter [Oscillospiraceae bacterium]|jgi:DHA1 family multidrug resistance protein-like MFS transporter|nr:MFS transporter [Oscillospiraceae bacterium]